MIDLIVYALVTLLCLFLSAFLWARWQIEQAADDIANTVN